jgi:hypothetical protein
MKMKVKTSEAEDRVLDYLVAKCEGRNLAVTQALFVQQRTPISPIAHLCLGRMHYLTDWAQGGLIIEREKLGVWWATHYVDDDGVEYGNHWYAEPGCTDDNADKPYRVATGPTPLIAAMRCYVVNKLGDEVEVPDEVAS